MGLVGWVVDRIFSIFDRDRPPLVQDPQRYECGRVAFEYPRNWKIDEEDVREGCHSVHLDTAMGSVCCVTLMVPNTGMQLADYAEGAVAGFHEGIGEAFRVGSFAPFRADGWALDPVTRQVAGEERQGVRLDVASRGFGQSITSRFEIHHVDEPDYCVFVLANSVEAERWDVELSGYELLWRSLSVDVTAAQR